MKHEIRMVSDRFGPLRSASVASVRFGPARSRKEGQRLDFGRVKETTGGDPNSHGQSPIFLFLWCRRWNRIKVNFSENQLAIGAL